VDYIRQIYLPALDDVAMQPPIARISVERWGWYPRGGGILRATIPGGAHLRSLTLTERGSLREVSVLSAASNLPGHVVQRQADRADLLLRKRGTKPRVKTITPPSPGPGTAVFVRADYRHTRAGFTGYGRLRKPAERVAEQACKAYARYHKRGQPIDLHLADQFVLPLALAHHSSDLGRSVYAVESVTQHLQTQAWLVQQYLDRVLVEIEGNEGEPGIVTIYSARVT
jgi:RNA 3'-terminal phosphate cyclase (ATP)